MDGYRFPVGNDAGDSANTPPPQKRRRQRRSEMGGLSEAGSSVRVGSQGAPSAAFSNAYSSYRSLSRAPSMPSMGLSQQSSMTAPTAASQSHAVEKGRDSSPARKASPPASEATDQADEVEDRNVSIGVIGMEKKLRAEDHILITAGPPDWIEGPLQPFHGGRPDNDRYGLDPKSACTTGAFVKPWLRVPPGGCLPAKLRSRTDRKVWWSLVGVWALIVFCAIFGFLDGDLERLRTGGTDALGNVCGGTLRTRPPDVVLDDLGVVWEDLQYLWFPIDPEELGAGIDAVKRHGVCVSKCPRVQPTAVNWTKRERDAFAVKQYYWDADVSPGAACERNATCRARNYCSADRRVGCVRQFRVLYPTVAIHRFCVPNVWGDTEAVDPAVLELAREFAHKAAPHVADWWFSVTADLLGGARVLFLSFALNFVCGELYLLSMRKSPIATAWVAVLLLVAACIATAVQFFDHYTFIDGLDSQGRLSNRKRYQSQFRTLAWLIIAVGVINALLCIRLRAKVTVASHMMVEANKVLRESPGMSLIVPAVWMMHLGLAALASTLMVWIGTIGTIEEVGGAQLTTIHRNADVYHLRPVVLELSAVRPYLQLVLVFGVLWAMGLLNMIAYNLTAYLSVMWYFSSPGEPKEPPKNGIWLTLSCIRMHIGSYSVAAVLLTWFESIRGLLDSIHGRLRDILQKINELHRVLKYFTCLIQFVLMLFDKFLKLVRRDAFVVQAIEGSDFTRAARRAGHLFEKFRAQVEHIADVCETVSLFGRLGIISVIALAATIPLLHTEWGHDIDNPIVVMIFAYGWAFFVSTLYSQITTAAMDTFIMSYCYDMDVNDGSLRRPLFTHVSLKRFIDKHSEIENDYRNIHEGKDVLTLSGWRQMVNEARENVREGIRQTRSQTREAAKVAQQKTKKLAEEAEAAARKTKEAAKGAANAAAAAGEAVAGAAAKVGEKVHVPAAGSNAPAGRSKLAKAGGFLKKMGEGIDAVDQHGKRPGLRKGTRPADPGPGLRSDVSNVALGSRSGPSQSNQSNASRGGRSIAGSRVSR